MRLEARNLSYAYGPRRVFEGLSFSVGDGELFAVLGPNGAGKSTLFRCLLALLRDYGGSILVDGAEIRGLKERELSRLVAYIPQAHAAVFDYSALEVVLMGAAGSSRTFATPSPRDEAAALAELDKLGVAELADRSYARLSGGERQLVLIARALAQKARILVMDEPTANLDYGNQVRVMERVASLSKRGFTVILSTHNPEQAFLWATRAAVLFGGGFVADGRPAEVLSEELLARVYGVRVRLFPLGEGGNADYRCCVPESAVAEEELRGLSLVR
jgi:iron complex transport system ATP-binding protein